VGEFVDCLAEVVDCQCHLDPLAEPAAGREADDDPADIERIVRETTGAPPRSVRFLHTDEGVVVFLTLAIDPAQSLADAHAIASRVEERIWVVVPGVAEVIVHTEP
jgi:divalent metal cation (Fe/Co/Zn/Cd) transporter